MSIKMRIIHPHKTETYRVGYDDSCLVLSSGGNKYNRKVWISKSMCHWISRWIKRIEKRRPHAKKRR